MMYNMISIYSHDIILFIIYTGIIRIATIDTVLLIIYE